MDKVLSNKFHAGNGSDGKHYWLTPPELYGSLHAEFNFTFDPCPFPKPDDFDGLTSEWGSSSYVNPPFGFIIHEGKKKGPTAWARKAIAESKKGKRVVLVYPIDKWVLMLLAAGAQVRNLGDVRWLATEDGSIGKGTGRHIACFVLEPSPTPEAIEALKAKAEAATQGDWIALNMVNMDGTAMTADDLGLYVKNSVTKTINEGGSGERFLFISTAEKDAPDICHIGNGPSGPANAAFIAGAKPSVVLSLISTITQLRARAEAADEQLRLAKEGVIYNPKGPYATGWNEAIEAAAKVAKTEEETNNAGQRFEAATIARYIESYIRALKKELPHG